jgi:plastocyanin
MGFRLAIWCVLTLIPAATMQAAEIDGTVIIHRPLTKRKVTVQAGAYERGVAVAPGLTAEGDVLGFERNHVVIYLEGDLPSKSATATMNQKNKQFVPDLLAVSAGSNVSFPNLDPIFHNVFSLSKAKAKAFDLGNYSMDKTRAVAFTKPGIVFVNCHLHPNMTAAIVVTPNSFSVRAGEDGHFSLSDVPPGVYTIVAWHKAAGFFRKAVTVGDGPVAPVTFLIPLAANP